MAGGTAGEGDEEITGINVAPLVDVMLVLLVIFMVTASYIVNQSINVNLPKAETADTAQTRNISFVLDSQSKLSVDGKPVEMGEVDALIATAKAEKGADVQALIAADRDTPHGVVIQLIDTVRRNGISDFAMSVDAAAMAGESKRHEASGVPPSGSSGPSAEGSRP